MSEKQKESKRPEKGHEEIKLKYTNSPTAREELAGGEVSYSRFRKRAE